MYGLAASVWPEALADRTPARDRQRQIAIYDARIAEERTAPASQRSEVSLVGRLRQSLGVAPAPTDCAACVACAA